jgi:beta-D-xylosidase 4
VLLANPKGALPLARSSVASVALVGPLANSSKGTNGGPNYAGIPCGGSAETLLAAFSAAGLTTSFAAGCSSIACSSTAGFAAATAAAAAADATIVVVGLDETIEDEALDRTYLTLPGNQSALISAACSAARGPCIVVLMSGGSVDLSSALPSVTGGIFYAGFLGGHGAPAVVDTVFGASAPAGRLSQTFYPASFVDAVSLFEMNVRPGPSAWPPGTNPGRSNKFYTGTPVFPFGYGLSYTTWSVSVDGPAAVSLAPVQAYLRAHSSHGARFAPLPEALGSGLASYRVNVTNTGSVDSDYVVLGFLVPPGAGSGGAPLQSLFGFERVRVAAGQTVSVWLGVGERDLTRVLGGARVPVGGQWRLRVGLQGEAGPAAELAFEAQ